MSGFNSARPLAASLVLLLISSTALAEEWKSPDGIVAVEIPDPTRFVQVEKPARMLAQWRSSDAKVVFGVEEVAVPKNVVFQLSMFQDNFLRDLKSQFEDASVLSSSTESRYGHEVFINVGKARAGGQVVRATQIAFPYDGKCYLIEVIIGIADRQCEADTIAFIKSFRPIVAKRVTPTQREAFAPASATGQPVQQNPQNNISFKLGYLAGMLLIFALVIAAITRVLSLGKKREPDDEEHETPRRKKRRRNDDESPQRKPRDDDE